jgi:hypothetical protein
VRNDAVTAAKLRVDPTVVQDRVTLRTFGGGDPGFAALGRICSSSPLEFQINTWDTTGALSNNVPFTAVIP